MILVFGSSGTVGREVIKQLQANGAAYREAQRDNVDWSGVDKVFLLSPSSADFELAQVEAAKAHGVKHIVKLSVLGAEKEAFSFAKLHRAIERAIEQSGIAWTFLRPNGFMQNMHNYSGDTIRSQGAIYQSAGDGRVSHVDVRDIAAVAAAALTEPGHEGKAYPLTGPEALTYGEVAKKISDAAGRNVNYVALTPEQHKAGIIGAGIPEQYADALLDLNRVYREGGMSEVTDDVKRITGRDPIAFDQYARENAAQFSA